MKIYKHRKRLKEMICDHRKGTENRKIKKKGQRKRKERRKMKE